MFFYPKKVFEPLLAYFEIHLCLMGKIESLLQHQQQWKHDLHQ